MKSKITIIYKSGVKIHAKADKFTVTSYNNGGANYKWEGLEPIPLRIGADEIAAIYEGHV